MKIFYFIVKDTYKREKTIIVDKFLGEIGDLIIYDSELYTIIDWACENLDSDGDSLYW